MRTLNLQLTVIVMTIAIVFGGGAYFLHGYQVQRNAYVFKRESELLEELAKEAAKKKDGQAAGRAYRDAIRNLSWYVRLAPSDIEAMEKLGLMTADMARDRKSLEHAFGLLEQVLRVAPERTKVRRRLVSVVIALGRFQDGKLHLQELLKESPQDAELWDLQGRCHAGRGEYEQAASSFKKAVDLAPNRTETYVELAVVVGTYQSRPHEAQQWYDAMVQRNPKSWQAHLSRGVHLFAAATVEESLGEALKSLELHADNPGALVLAARCYLAKRDVAKSRLYSARGIELYPNNAAMYINMADVESAAKNNDKAIAVVRRGLAVTGENPQLLWTLANRLINTNQLEQARKTIGELQSHRYQMSSKEEQATELQFKPLLEYLNAHMEAAQGHWLAARQGFEKSRRYVLTPEGQDLRKLADLSIGICFGRLGSVDQQIEALRRA